MTVSLTSPTTSELAFLQRCPPIAALSADARQTVLAAVNVASVRGGADILSQGAPGDAFYVLLEGTVEVLQIRNGRTIRLRELAAGAYFGEQALLGRKAGRRSATVRAKGDCRVGSISAVIFNQLIAATGQNRDRFERDAASYVYCEIRKSLDAFLDCEVNQSTAGVERRTYAVGETLMRQGELADSVFLILSGVTVANKDFQGQRRDIARMGTGQLIGELGVLSGAPRAATVTAQSEVEALQIDANAFRRWHSGHPDVAGFFNSLSHVYKLSQDRQLLVFLGDVGGAQAVTSVVGRVTGGMVSTRVLEHGVVVFSNGCANSIAGDREEIRYADNSMSRTLRVIVTARHDGMIAKCVVYAIAAQGIESDLGTLYQHVQNLDEVPSIALRRFERTGFLGGSAPRSDRLCPCLGLGASELVAAVHELGNDYALLQETIGIGGICGGCERPVRAFLALQEAGKRAAGGCVIGTADEVRVPYAQQSVADVPLDQLNADEKQLAALLSRGLGLGPGPVTYEQVAVRLRATDVRDMKFFIDLLFPTVFTQFHRATYAALAAAVGRGIGFGRWREQALQPRRWHQVLLSRTVQLVYRLGRRGVVSLLAVLAAVHFLLASQNALLLWSSFLVFLVITYGALSLTPSGRFLRVYITGGPSRFHRAIWAAFGNNQTLGKLRINPWGKPIYVVRDEQLVDEILQHPDIYARTAVTGYPAFAEHSVLGGGSSGVWLGYRMLCEEYFAERYREDLDQMRVIVRQRLAMWESRDSIDLLQELYRMVIEIHSQLFFQTSFGCFDDKADVDYADLIDRTLGPAVMLFNDPLGGDVALLRTRCTAAVCGASRQDSVGGILREAWQAGEINEREACENAVMYMLAQAPAIGSFWTIYRAVRCDNQAVMAGNRRELVKAIKEEMRLHAPVSTMFNRIVLRDSKLGDYQVEKGARIFLSPMFIHTNSRQWELPYEHNPQRWEAQVGDATEIVDPKTDSSDCNSRPQPVPGEASCGRYLPFGGGGQACQGRWFAADEMLVVIEEIFKHYELRIIDDQDLLAKPLYDQVQFHVYNRPYNSVRMKPVSRQDK